MMCLNTALGHDYVAFKLLQTAVSNLAITSKLLRSAHGTTCVANMSAIPFSRLTLHSKLGSPDHDNVPLGLR